VEKFEWEPYSKSQSVLVDVKDIFIDYPAFLLEPSKKAIAAWLCEGNESYRKYCSDMRNTYLSFTYHSFLDVIQYVAASGVNINPVTINKFGGEKYIVCNGKHRWCAAYLLDIPQIPCIIL